MEITIVFELCGIVGDLQARPSIYMALLNLLAEARTLCENQLMFAIKLLNYYNQKSENAEC